MSTTIPRSAGSTPRTARTARTLATLGVAGAAWSVGSQLLGVVATRDAPWWLAYQCINVLAWPLLIAGVVGLWRSGLVGERILGRIGIGLCLIGLSLFTVIEAALIWWHGSPGPFHAVAEPMTSIGMIIAAIAVLRTGRWQSASRFTPLAAGLGSFVLNVPALIVLGGDSTQFLYVLAVFWTLWLVMFVSLRAATQYH